MRTSQDLACMGSWVTEDVQNIPETLNDNDILSIDFGHAAPGAETNSHVSGDLVLEGHQRQTGLILRVYFHILATLSKIRGSVSS